MIADKETGQDKMQGEHFSIRHSHIFLLLKAEKMLRHNGQ